VKKSFYIGLTAALCAALSVCAVDDEKHALPVHSLEYDGIIAVVNGDIITFSDLESRVNMIVFSTGGNVSGELKAKISREVLREMVQETLKWQCAKKYEPAGGWVPQEAIQSTFSDIAKRNDMNAEEFKALLVRHRVDPNILFRQIKINLSWIEYIKARFGKFINISESEMSRTVAEIKEKENKESYFVYRMFFPVSNPSDESKVLKHVTNLSQMLSRGADFVSVARQFSQSSNVGKGDDVTWVLQGQLSEEEDAALAKMATGTHTVVRNSRGYAILFLKDKREAGARAFTELKVVQIVAPFSTQTPSADEVEKLKNYINDMKKTSHNCREIIKIAKESGFCGVSNAVTTTLDSMAQDFRKVISKISTDMTSEPIITPVGIAVVCLLDKQIHQVKEPSRDDLKIQKMNERLSVFADRESQDFKKKAYIKIDEKYGTVAEIVH
jgi:peptidyl-prolyl cis-trans isomerase SurA